MKLAIKDLRNVRDAASPVSERRKVLEEANIERTVDKIWRNMPRSGLWGSVEIGHAKMEIREALSALSPQPTKG